MALNETANNCPVWGAEGPSRLQYSKMVVCGYCQTSLFIEDQAVKQAGVKSVLTEIPSILELGRRFQYRNWTFEPYSRIRFDYEDGIWDEWWVILDSGVGKWISVDEGDIAVEGKIELKESPPDFDSMQVGATVGLLNQRLKVTEKNSAKCAGLEGELPEVIFPGDTHDYVHLSGPRGLILTVEYFEDKVEASKGVWIDPFDLKPI
ncbi:MAG: hypothetical protein DRQ37_04360 [Gammaproteobacteria bacterium]|nr:MAG: hypothetical protein DRQ37_04360 [Gammaproteobacteria bacterium]